jgi:tRNA-dihydrouridine synthase
VLGAPWFFRDKEEARRQARIAEPVDIASWTPPLAARFEMLLAHARQFDAQWGPQQFRRMRKHLGWYCKGFPYAAALRARMFLVSSVSDVEAVLDDYRDGRLIDGETAFLASRCG